MEVALSFKSPHKAQRYLKQHQERFTVASMGRRWGKSEYGLVDLVDGAKGALHGFPTAWAAPNYGFLLEAWRNAEQTLEPVIKRKSTQDKRLELIGGGSIQYLSLDNPAAGRSQKFSRLVVDEAAHARNLETAWQQSLRPTLSDYQGCALFLSSPNGSNYFKTLHSYGDKASEHKRKGWRSFTLGTHTNPHIAKSEIEDARRDLPTLIFNQEYLGEFVSLSGTLVTSEMLRYKSLLQQIGFTSMGVDLAISQNANADYCAISVITSLPTGEVYVRETIRFKKPFHLILQEIERMAVKWNPQIIGIESVQFQAAVTQELVRKTKLPIKAVHPDKSKVVRFLPLLAKYEQGLVYHPPGYNPEAEAELLSFGSLQANDDMVDSLSLAYHCSKFSNPAISVFTIQGL